MAKLKDFIDQVSFDEVWALLGQDRENMEQYKEACQSIYSELQAATPAENTDHYDHPLCDGGGPGVDVLL